MKTAVTVLQEMMVKLNETPEYECISQSGPQHSATFEYRCAARGAVVTGAARSKKEAKQEAARLMLLKLAAHGEDVPPPYGLQIPKQRRTDSTQGMGESSGGAGAGAAGGALGSRSYVALLKDLCDEYRLPTVQYELVSDTGPAHMRQFTIRASVAAHTRLATATTKKMARQLAAHQLYTYLRENLARLTKDFVEEEALVRAYEKAVERYTEPREDAPWRPDLGQRVADYHTSLFAHIDEKKRAEVMEALTTGEEDAEIALATAADALGLSVKYSYLEASPATLIIVELTPTLPEVALVGIHRVAAAADALGFLRIALQCAAAAAESDADVPLAGPSTSADLEMAC